LIATDSAWEELHASADAAEELGMKQGDHFWAWFGNFDPTIVYGANT
jgi:hypothetical protein